MSYTVMREVSGLGTSLSKGSTTAAVLLPHRLPRFRKHIEGTSSPQLNINLASALSLADVSVRASSASSLPQLELADLSLEETATARPGKSLLGASLHTTRVEAEAAGRADEGEGSTEPVVEAEAQVAGAEAQSELEVEEGGAEAESEQESERPEQSEGA